MTTLLLLQALLQRFHQLLPSAERFDLTLFLLAQGALHEFAQPLFRKAREQILEGMVGSLEVRGEGSIETIEMPLVFH